MQATYTVNELMAMNLPVLPGSERSISRRADREQWPFYWETVRGGSCKMYRAHMLPDYLRQAILDHENIHALVPATLELIAQLRQKEPAWFELDF